MIFPLEIFEYILNLCDFKTQIYLVSLNKFLSDNLKIIDLCHIQHKYLDLLTDKILKQQKFNQLDALNDRGNIKITNVSMISSLKILCAYSNCGIDQNGIHGLDLVELYADYNEKIIDVSMIKSLKKLCASDSCGIDQNGINGLDLVELNANHNNKINNVSMMKSLKKLYACGECGIDQNGEPTMANMAGPALPGIRGLDLVKLYASDNKKIIDVSTQIFC
jgi:hypothetical protein